MVLPLRVGMEMKRGELINRLIAMNFDRNDVDFPRDKFRVRGDVVEIIPASYTNKAVRDRKSTV